MFSHQLLWHGMQQRVGRKGAGCKKTLSKETTTLSLKFFISSINKDQFTLENKLPTQCNTQIGKQAVPYIDADGVCYLHFNIQLEFRNLCNFHLPCTIIFIVRHKVGTHTYHESNCNMDVVVALKFSKLACHQLRQAEPTVFITFERSKNKRKRYRRWALAYRFLSNWYTFVKSDFLKWTIL